MDQLRARYPELAEEPLMPVSVIGNAQDLSELSDDSVDFVVANHLFEHLDNPILGMTEMVRVLRPSGVLYLALPEPRVTFDSKRDLTTVQHVLDEYRDGPDRTREAHFTEWVERVEAHLEGNKGQDVPARVRFLAEVDYSIHFHVWRPDTFIDFLAATRAETGIELELVDFAPCHGGEDNEFIFVFHKGIAATPPSNPALPSTATSWGAIKAREAGGAVAYPAIAGVVKGMKRWVARSSLGPLLRPIYRAGLRSYSAARHSLTRD